MAIPDFQTLMLPVLRYVAPQKGDVSVRAVSNAMAVEFKLSEEEIEQRLPSGRAPQFYNRVQWSITHLRKAGLLTTPRRGFVAVTDRGREVLAKRPVRVDMRLLAEFDDYTAFRASKASPEEPRSSEDEGAKLTPLEDLERGYKILRESLAADLLVRVKGSSPEFFERLVVELLLKMGYGGSRTDAGRAIGRSGDEGIDGFIKEDRLGLETIYLQAKRWIDKAVGRPDVQQFQGALTGAGATRGIFLTTSTFSRDAVAYAEGLRGSKIVLIDGVMLVGLMIDHGIGVATAATYEVQRIDSDYFTDDEE